MLGQVFGGVNNRTRAQVAKKTINTLQDIEASRQAYADSQLMYGFLKSYSNKSDELLSTLLRLSNDAKDLMGVAPFSAKAKSIAELCDKTSEALGGFKEAAGLTDDYANQLLNLYTKYHDEVSAAVRCKKN